MAEFKLSAGATVDLLTKGELDDALKAGEAREAAAIRGVKSFRFLMVGNVVSSACTIGDPGTANAGAILTGPEQGYVWCIKHLVIEGLTASSSAPDTMNVYRNGRIIWQLNGNQFCQTWGSGQIMVKPGEAVYFKNSGNLTATGQITVHGTVWNVPAELEGKLA